MMSVVVVTREHAFRAAQNAVRNQGYAVALHGSQVRDLDLVAIPWQETAIDARTCAESIAEAIPGALLEPPEEKPYGRLAWEIHPLRMAGHKWGHGFDQWYIDLSVMPRCVGAEESREALYRGVLEEIAGSEVGEQSAWLIDLARQGLRHGESDEIGGSVKRMEDTCDEHPTCPECGCARWICRGVH